MFSEGMRREFAVDGIRLAVISPGVVATDLFAGDDDTTEKMARKADEAGLDADDVAATIVGLLRAPALRSSGSGSVQESVSQFVSGTRRWSDRYRSGG